MAVVRTRRLRRGNFLILFGVLLTVLMGFGALTIDISHLRNCQMELQTAVDAAAHAALVDYRRTGSTTSARETAKTVAAANSISGRPVHLADSDIVFGTWNYLTDSFSTAGAYVNAVQVHGERSEGSTDGPIHYFLGPIIGTASGEIQANATSAFRFREIMLVLDTTPSFRQDIDNGVDAVVTFLDEVHAQNLPQDRMGLILMAQVATKINGLTSLTSEYSNLRSYWLGEYNASYGYDRSYNCHDVYISSLHEYHTSCSFVDRSSGIQICYIAGQYAPMNQPWFDAGRTVPNLNCYDGSPASPPEEGTYHAPGLEMAIDELVDNGNPGNIKVIVMVSDGRPKCYTSNFTEETTCDAERRANAILQSNRAEDLGISIWSVMFCSNCNGTQLAQYTDYSKELAAGAGRGYGTDESDQLDDILTSIAKSLPIALVE